MIRSMSKNPQSSLGQIDGGTIVASNGSCCCLLISYSRNSSEPHALVKPWHAAYMNSRMHRLAGSCSHCEPPIDAIFDSLPRNATAARRIGPSDPGRHWSRRASAGASGTRLLWHRPSRSNHRPSVPWRRRLGSTHRPLTTFWSSVVLISGRYHGNPMAPHLKLPLEPRPFARWLTLFERTTRQVCSEAAATLLPEKARRIAQSLQLGIDTKRGVLPPRQQPA